MMSSHFRHYPLALALFLWCMPEQSAEAQIVNVLPMASGEEGFSGAVNGTLDWRQGNVDSLRTGGDVLLSAKSNSHLVFLITRGELGIKSDQMFLGKIFEHLRYRVRVGGRWSLEHFAQHAYDKFQRIKFRVLLGSGLRFDVVEWDGGAVAFGTSYMPEFEELSATVSDSGLEFFHRWSNYLTFMLQFGEPFSFQSTTYIQPRFDAMSDYRLSNESGFQIQVQDVFVSPFAFGLAYDSRPPETVEGLDLTIKSSLGVRF